MFIIYAEELDDNWIYIKATILNITYNIGMIKKLDNGKFRAYNYDSKLLNEYDDKEIAIAVVKEAFREIL